MNDKSNSDEIREGATPVTRTEPPSILIGPEYAFAEEDVREVVAGEVIVGTSLWRDAWRRLMKNKLAVLGMIIVIAIVIAAVFGPSVIKAATGYSYDFIPKDPLLTKSFAPFRAPDGRLSWTHPMGPRASAVRPADILDGRIDFNPRFAGDWRFLRRDGWIYWRTPRRSDDENCRRALLIALRDHRDRSPGNASGEDTNRSIGGIVSRARGSVVADDGAHCPRPGDVA